MSQVQKLTSLVSALTTGCGKKSQAQKVMMTLARPLSAAQANEKLKIADDSSPESSEKVAVRMNPRSTMNVDVSWLRKNCSCDVCNKLYCDKESKQSVMSINEAGEGDWFEIVWRDGHVSWFNKDWLKDNYKN